MTDLPKSLRGQLAEEFQIWTTRVEAHPIAADGTEKLLLSLGDGNRIECVLLRDDKQNRTVCISTQVGCAMGCVFCASGLDGVARNLTTGEILEELLHVDRLLPALAIAASPRGLAIGARRITISTVGIPKAIRRLADENHAYHLAVSLHAPDDELRNRLVPTNRKVGIAAILEAADYYFDKTGRRPTYEYVLLGGLNDQPEHAHKLAALLAGRPALVNVIPYNPVAGLPYETPPSSATARFVQILEQAGLAVAVRWRKGDRIDAACGQLRRSHA
jgi:23S rRNA (adenine2503-C2)-methyltransferase